MSDTPLPILYEDNHLLVVNKPTELVTQGAPAGETSLAEQAKQYLKEKYNKPGKVYLGVVSRIDAKVSGAIVLARTSKAAARLSEQFRERTVRKIYWAVIPDELPEAEGEFVDHMRKHEPKRRMMTCRETDADAQLARLKYRTLQTLHDNLRLVEVQLETGRKHQIRVQFASRDCAILGDRKYDSPHKFSRGIALHARELEFAHPITKERLTFLAELPIYWSHLGISEM